MADYTKQRTSILDYTIDDIIGRHDSVDTISTTSITVSGTPTIIPTLGRRNYIKIQNIGAVDVSIVSTSGSLPTDGFIVDASGGVFEDTTGATIYVVSTGADSEVRIYQRSTK